jgi:adenylate cyclase
LKLALRRSLAARLALATALLVIPVIALLVERWADGQRAAVRQGKLEVAHTLALAASHAAQNELNDENWSQLRVFCEFVARDRGDVVYLLIHDVRRANRIIAAVPGEAAGRFVPALVPAPVTAAALASDATLTQETVLLRDAEDPSGRASWRRGEPLIEVSHPIRRIAGERLGVMRVGVSLAGVDAAVAEAVEVPLAIGLVALLASLGGALMLARRLARPVVDLQRDAARIAAGDLAHRARVARADEIGALGEAFNDMGRSLEASFGRLQRTNASFERFVPRKFLAVVAPEGIENIQVGTSARRTIAVLFSDIRGYTQISSGMAPEAVFALLNDYLARMGRAIDESGGFVDKYIGDAIMALFDDANTDGLVDAMVSMRRALRELNAKRAAAGLAPLDNGIGAHCGEVVMGTIGFASKIESTVVGDAVNVASRVEGLTKALECGLLLTRAVVDRLAEPSRHRLRLVAEGVAVRGRAEPVDLFTVDDDPPS